MCEFRNLFKAYDRLVVFDTETTGLNFERDEIIEFAAVVIEPGEDEAQIVEQYDELVALSPVGHLPREIVELTGITLDDLEQRGIRKDKLCEDIARLFAGNTLLIAYNAHFDLSFLYYLLFGFGDVEVLKGKDKLDLLTVYKDRHSYPHKLAHAIKTYDLEDSVVNSHRAIADVLATCAVMAAMDREKSDLDSYVNLFGYNPKYGVSGKRIGSVTYKPQRFDPWFPLYKTK